MQKYKVLVIDDVESAGKQLAKVIRKEGFEVVVAENGRSGLEIFRKELPEIIITDLRMPEIDGLELMHTLKRLSPKVQIILITAFGETDTAIMALHQGVLDYLKKPLDLDQLTVALGRAKENIDEYKAALPFPTLLLAEDEEKTRERLSRVLKKEDWQVFQAADGDEAMDVFRQTKIDIVLMDIRMPKKNGLKTLHEMRGLTSDFEAIILSGYGDEANAIQAMRDGAINFLRKPIDLDQLVIAVEKALEKLNTLRALRYRSRELELSKQLIAKITTEKEIIIDLRDYTRKPALEFVRQLLDALPMGLVVVDRDMKIRYVNHHLLKGIEYQPERIDEEFVKGLVKLGLQGLSLESLISSVNKLFESSPGAVETINTGQYGYLALASVTILGEEKKEEIVLITIRGERR